MTTGLTTMGDIPLLYEKLQELKQYIDAKVDELKSETAKLQDFAFESFILEQPDSDWETVRKKRDFLLKITDWTMIHGASVDQREWAAYRQKLRDLPQRFSGAKLEDLAWPAQPSTSGPNTIEKK